MDGKDLTSCCGLYCPDCIWYRNSFSQLAKKLKDTLEEIDFERYASVRSPFGVELEYYKEFLDILDFIAENDCLEPCRIGGGCGGHPCKIMNCAEQKKLAGCWQCEEMESCGKFDFIEPRCGDTPKNNLRNIKKLGYDGWIKERGPYYIWQRKES
jgi:hypothetical protein